MLWTADGLQGVSLSLCNKNRSVDFFTRENLLTSGLGEIRLERRSTPSFFNVCAHPLRNVPANARQSGHCMQVALPPWKEHWNLIRWNASLSVCYALLSEAATFTIPLVCAFTMNILPFRRLGCNTFRMIVTGNLFFSCKRNEGKPV